MSPLVVVAAMVAGAIGALIRYAIARALARRPFPWAVLIVNIVGCAIAGVTLGIVDQNPDPTLWLIVVGGFAGGLTTFSTFAVESMQLSAARRYREVILSVVANCVGGFLALGLAWVITRWAIGGLLA